MFDDREQRVAAAGREAHERRLDAERIGRREVTLQVVDRCERQAARIGDRLGGGKAHEQRADQPGAGRDRDGVEVVPACPGVGQRGGDRRHEQLGVTSRGDLRHDPAERGVELMLRRDDRRADGRRLGGDLDHGRARVVARGLDAQQEAQAESPSHSFHMMSASSRLSE